jgi:hypothetical protein
MDKSHVEFSPKERHSVRHMTTLCDSDRVLWLVLTLNHVLEAHLYPNSIDFIAKGESPKLEGKGRTGDSTGHHTIYIIKGLFNHRPSGLHSPEKPGYYEDSFLLCILFIINLLIYFLLVFSIRRTTDRNLWTYWSVLNSDIPEIDLDPTAPCMTLDKSINLSNFIICKMELIPTSLACCED